MTGWVLLIVISVSGQQSQVTVIDNFATEKKCQNAGRAQGVDTAKRWVCFPSSSVRIVS